MRRTTRLLGWAFGADPSKYAGGTLTSRLGAEIGVDAALVDAIELVGIGSVSNPWSGEEGAREGWEGHFAIRASSGSASVGT